VEKLSPQENSKIAGMLNFDMMASHNGGYFINKGSMDKLTPSASGYIQRLWEQGFESFALPWHWSGLGGSDYVSFLEAGIPAGGIAAGASSLKTEEMAKKFGGVAGKAYAPCYHKPCDVFEKFDRQRLLMMTKVTAYVTDLLVTDPRLKIHLARSPTVRSLPASDEGVNWEAEAKCGEDDPPEN